MIKRTVFASVFFAVAGVLAGQQDADLTAAMKASDKAMDVIRKADPKTGKEVLAAAERLGGIYENMVPFWRQRNAAKAVRISEEGKAAAAILASAANSGNAEEVAGALKQLDGTCRSCHEQYREKLAEGKYRIKLP